MAKPRSDARNPRERPRISAPVLLAFGGLLAGAIVVSTALGGPTNTSDDTTQPPVSSTPTPTVPRPPIEPDGVRDGPSDPPPITAEVMNYRIVYASDGYGPTGSVSDTEVHRVRRPFEARVDHRVGPPPGADGGFTLYGFGFTEVAGAEQRTTPIVNEPNLPLGDVGLLADLDDAIDAGVIVYLAQEQTILGRTCHRYRTGSSIDVAVLTTPTDDAFADICVDEAGLVLSESWVVDGELFRRRTAVELDVEPDFPDDLFSPSGTPMAFAGGGGVFGEVTPDSEAPGVDHWWLGQLPDGFEHRGRFAFGSPRAEVASESAPTTRVVGLVDILESGADVIVVVNAGSEDKEDVLGDLGPERADIGALGEAAVRRRTRGSELIIPLERGRFVRMHATLPLDELLELARQLTLSPASDDHTVDTLQGGEVLLSPTTTVHDDTHDHDHTGDGDGHHHGDGEADHSHD